MSALTQTQAEVLSFIRASLSVRGFPPTRKEIADRFGWTSKNAAQHVISTLQAKGCLSVESGVSRGIRLA